MARILDAVRDYGPRLVLSKTVGLDELAEWMASRTGIHQSQVVMVLSEINEAISTFGRRGEAVRLPGVGRFAPSIRRDGRLRVNYRPDVGLRTDLNVASRFRGEVRNRANIGLDNAGYKALWDADHPEDPLEI